MVIKRLFHHFVTPLSFISQTKRLVNIICCVSYGIYHSDNLVLLWLSTKFRWLLKSFKSSDPFRPKICVGEVKWLWGWDLVNGHRIPLLTPCKIGNSITTLFSFKTNCNNIYIYTNQSAKSKGYYNWHDTSPWGGVVKKLIMLSRKSEADRE